MALGVTDLKKGTIFLLDSQPYKVVEYSQKVMGRGGSIVNVKIKSLIDGKVLDKTFKGNEQFELAHQSLKKAQYLYTDGTKYYFMDNDTFEQFELDSINSSTLTDYVKEGEEVQIQLLDSQPIGVELPKNIALKVIYAEDAVKGDTSSAITKDAKVETGLKVRVPAFIKQNDVISIDTASGAYRARIKD